MANPKYANFLEFRNVAEANGVDLSRYTFLERISATRGTFCFKIRESKRNESTLKEQ